MQYRIFRRTHHSRVECDCGFKQTVRGADAERIARYHPHLTPTPRARNSGGRASNGRSN